MEAGGPYRALPKFLMCPRCGELLERAFDDVLACMRCEGIWITPPTVAIAFGNPDWPTGGSALWWRNELECPECAHAGQSTMMSAQLAEGVQIDRCKMHGLWLDRGELGRLAGGTGHELDELRRKLRGGEPDLDKLAAKREAWRRDVDTRRKAAEEYNQWLAAERARQIQNADARERDERAPDAYEQIQRENWKSARRVALVTTRDELTTEIDALEHQISRLRAELHVAEADLAGARIKMRGLDEQISKA